MSLFDSILGAAGDDSDAFQRYTDLMNQNAQRFQPFVDYGLQGLGRANNEYARSIANPNAVQDQIAGGFYESPYQKLLQDLVTKRMNIQAANTGMLPSGGAQRALQDELTGMTGQFMNDYINRGMGSYDKSVAGSAGLGELGLNAQSNMSNILGEAAGGELQGMRSRNGAQNSLFGDILGGVGGLMSAFPGVGGMAGTAMKGLGGFMKGFRGNPNQSTFDVGMGAR